MGTPTDNTFIAPATAAAQKEIYLPQNKQIQVSADALAGAEVVNIEIWQGTAYNAGGDQLTATEPVKLLEGPGYFRLSKGVTVGACGVYVTG